MHGIVKKGIKYFGLFILIYGALTLISIIPAVGSFFNSMYRQATQPILQTSLSKTYIRLKSEKSQPDLIRVEFASIEKVKEQMETARKAGQKSAPIQGNSFEFGFYNLFLTFFLFLVSLVLLSPLPLKEKILGILIGALVYYLFTVLKMHLALLIHFNEPEIAVYSTGETSLNIA